MTANPPLILLSEKFGLVVIDKITIIRSQVCEFDL